MLFQAIKRNGVICNRNCKPGTQRCGYHREPVNEQNNNVDLHDIIIYERNRIRLERENRINELSSDNNSDTESNIQTNEIQTNEEEFLLFYPNRDAYLRDILIMERYEQDMTRERFFRTTLYDTDSDSDIDMDNIIDSDIIDSESDSDIDIDNIRDNIRENFHRQNNSNTNSIFDNNKIDDDYTYIQKKVIKESLITTYKNCSICLCEYTSNSDLVFLNC